MEKTVKELVDGSGLPRKEIAALTGIKYNTLCQWVNTPTRKIPYRAYQKLKEVCERR